MTVPLADDDTGESAIPESFALEDDLAAAPCGDLAPDYADADIDESIPDLTGPAEDECVEDSVPDSFSSAEDVGDLTSCSFETTESEAGDDFGPASFESESEPGAGAVTFNFNVNKSN